MKNNYDRKPHRIYIIHHPLREKRNKFLFYDNFINEKVIADKVYFQKAIQ